MPTSDGRIKGITVPRVPWHETNVESQVIRRDTEQQGFDTRLMDELDKRHSAYEEH